MKIKRNKITSNQSGITLIALVITIIVLLILAAVAISMLAGDNGILRQAADAKTKTNQASVEEQIKLAVMAAIDTEGRVDTEVLTKEINKIDKGNRVITELPCTVVINGIKQIIESNGEVHGPATIGSLIESGNKVDENTTLEDTNKNNIIIPANFKLSKESPTQVTEGMIIEDSIGNQYVWIPVEANFASVATKTEDTAEYYAAIETALKTYTETYKDTNYKDVWYGSYGRYGYYDGSKFIYYTNGNMTEEEYNTLYHNMLKSVYKNKGFYIGRYEIGIGVANTTEEARNLTRTGVTEYTRSTDTSTSTTVKTNAAPSIEGMNTPISRANTVPYTWITQPQAQMLAKKLGEGSDYNNVNTSLMFGVQWDAVCVFIEKYDKNNTANTTSEWLTKNDYSKLWGNYNRAIFNINQGFYNVYQNPSPYIFPENWKNKDNKVSSGNWLCTTGASDQNSSLNIYDFGGNLSEWTLERHSYPGSPCTYRGGNFISSYCASYHDYNSICSADHSSSARASFYIK